VKLSEVEPFSGMLAAPNALSMTGGAITVMEAFEVFPVPASVELTVTLLFFTPPVVPVTFTETTQEALETSVPADKLTEEAPAIPLAVPPQLLVRAAGEAKTKPAGRLSVNATPVRLRLEFGF
jgi:hypothetical protein